MTALAAEALSTVQTAVLERGMKLSAQRAHDFQSALMKVDLQGMDFRSILPVLPFLDAVRCKLLSMQDAFDKLRTAYWNREANEFLPEIQIEMIDPVRILSSRTIRKSLNARAVTCGLLHRWGRSYRKTWNHLISCPVEELPDYKEGY